MAISECEIECPLAERVNGQNSEELTLLIRAETLSRKTFQLMSSLRLLGYTISGNAASYWALNPTQT